MFNKKSQTNVKSEIIKIDYNLHDPYQMHKYTQMKEKIYTIIKTIECSTFGIFCCMMLLFKREAT